MRKKAGKPRAKQQRRRKHALQQARFAREYLVDLNGKQAAIRVGCSPRSAAVTAARWLTQDNVAQIVAEGQAKALASLDLSASRVLEEIRRCAMSNVQDYWIGKGKTRRLKPIEDLTAAQAAAIGGMEVLIKNAEAGDGKTDKVHKFKLWDKPRSLEMLAKHFKLLTDLVQVEELDQRWARLDAGRKRNAERT